MLRNSNEAWLIMLARIRPLGSRDPNPHEYAVNLGPLGSRDPNPHEYAVNLEPRLAVVAIGTRVAWVAILPRLACGKTSV